MRKSFLFLIVSPFSLSSLKVCDHSVMTLNLPLKNLVAYCMKHVIIIQKAVAGRCGQCRLQRNSTVQLKNMFLLVLPQGSNLVQTQTLHTMSFFPLSFPGKTLSQSLTKSLFMHPSSCGVYAPPTGHMETNIKHK